MLARKYSLSALEINQVLQKKHFFNFSPFFCYYLPASRLQIAIAISKKIKSKPQKNKAKRQMKALLLVFLPKLKPQKLVFIIKANYYHFSLETIKENLSRCCQQLATKS